MIRVWLPAPGVVLVHRPEGFPMPAGHVEAVEATHHACRWLWDRRDAWPCFNDRQCDELATVCVYGWHLPKYYCERHTPVRPNGDPVARCRVCEGPLDPVLTTHGETTHPTCAPDEGDVAWDDALDALTAVTEETA
jgi:hypothetical protein